MEDPIGCHCISSPFKHFDKQRPDIVTERIIKHGLDPQTGRLIMSSSKREFKAPYSSRENQVSEVDTASKA